MGENRSNCLEILKPQAIFPQSSECIRLERYLRYLDSRLVAELFQFVILRSCVDTINETSLPLTYLSGDIILFYSPLTQHHVDQLIIYQEPQAK